MEIHDYCIVAVGNDHGELMYFLILNKLISSFRIWFETIMTCDDSQFVAQLIPVILERSGLMYGVPELVEDIHK